MSKFQTIRFALLLAATTCGVKFASADPIPDVTCTTDCSDINVTKTCGSTECGVYSLPDCSNCGVSVNGNTPDNSCKFRATTANDPTNECKRNTVNPTITVYPVTCEADCSCTGGWVYVEAKNPTGFDTETPNVPHLMCTKASFVPTPIIISGGGVE